jgi:hypothetical protein
VNSRYVNPYFSLDPDTQFIIQDAKKWAIKWSENKNLES